MAKTFPATNVTGSFTATGNGTAFWPVAAKDWALTIYGTFVGTAVLERSFDDGTTWTQVSSDNYGANASWTAPATAVINEPVNNASYRLRCSAYTSGTINYRLMQ